MRKYGEIMVKFGIQKQKNMLAIYELQHNDEWKRRVKYIIENHDVFGKKLEIYFHNKLLKM